MMIVPCEFPTRMAQGAGCSGRTPAEQALLQTLRVKFHTFARLDTPDFAAEDGVNLRYDTRADLKFNGEGRNL
jgi:hypothetical protein